MFKKNSSQTVLTMLVMIRNLLLFVLCIQLSVTVVAASSTQEKKQSLTSDEIKLTFLGTGSPRPSTKRYGPAILVEAGEFKLLVDAGPGLREHLRPDEPVPGGTLRILS